MSNSELSKTFYYNENEQYPLDGFNLIGCESSISGETHNLMDRSSDCRYQLMGNNMICPGNQRRRESLGQLSCSKTNSSKRHGRRPVGARPIYRHIPHRDKPPHLVARRNARERRRVQAVNNAFCRLRRHVPYENKQKRLSKVKTLRFAIDYINKLKSMVDEYDSRLSAQTNGLLDGHLQKKPRWSNERFFAIEKADRYETNDWSGYNKRLEHYSPM